MPSGPQQHTEAAQFDHHDRQKMTDPYPMFDRFREICPVFRSEQHEGFYVATSFDAVKAVYSKFRDFTSTEGNTVPRQLSTLIPIELDPPSHTRWRKVLNPFFTQDAASRDRSRIEAIVDGLIDQLIPSGQFDAATDFAQPITAFVMLPIIGVSTEDRPALAEALDYMAHHRTDDPDGWAQRSQLVAEKLMSLAAARRQEPAREDLLQTLIDVPIDGRLLDDAEVFQVLFLTLLGALDTTQSVLTQAILHLAKNPGDKARLSSGEVEWSTAVEEFIRFAAPIQALSRTATRDLELGGCPIAAGQPVIALNGAANRDPSMFERPNECLIDREINEHMSFGAGAHICIGRFYARTMIEVVLKAMLHRLPDFTVLEGFIPEFVAGEARSMASLPISFTLRTA